MTQDASPAAGRSWLVYALATVALWGVWGAIAGLSAERGFPETLVYCVWALTMVPPALIVLAMAGWRVVSVPYYDWHGLASSEREGYLKQILERAAM